MSDNLLRDGRRLVTIDGPGGAGKSSVARGVAARVGFRYLDTGATYRAVTLVALAAGEDVTDAAAMTQLAGDIIRAGRLYLSTDPAGAAVRLDDTDVSDRIRSAEVTDHVSAVSAHPGVRRILVRWQRQLADAGTGCVLEGRDCGTIVAPAAAVKIWLTARPEVRAARRDAEGVGAQGRGLAQRDRLDAQRMADPMRPAPDAVELDSSDRTLEALIDDVVDRVRALGRS